MPATLTPESVAAGGAYTQDPDRPPASEQAPAMYVLKLQKTRRSQNLHHLCSFVEGTQHDHHQVGWDGVPRDPGVGYLWERMRPQGFVPTNAVPYGDRKPDASYPLPRQVVMGFTNLLFGEGRHPKMQVPSDRDTESFLEVIMGESDAWDSFIEARDKAGSCGSAVLQLGVVNGEPFTDVHDTADIWVKRWKPGHRWQPELAFEQRLIETEQINRKTGELEEVRMWRTRGWDETYTYEYADVPEDWGEEDRGQGNPGPSDEPKPIPLRKVYEHNAGRCPLVWLQNTRNNRSPEGRPDNEGVLHLADKIDRLQSMVTRATFANVDPTLVYLDERLMHRGNPILRKGWGQVIRGSEKATVKLLEVSGTSVDAGWKGVQNLRDEYLQTVGCVIVDPQNAGAYKSGEALSLLWRSMEARANRLRVPLRDAIKQAAEIWLSIGGALDVVSKEDKKAQEYLVEVTEDGEEAPEGEAREIKPMLILPPQVEESEDGEAKSQAYKVGSGTHVEIVWPPYHVPTPTQWQNFVTALSVATGQKATLSQETAVALLLAFAGKGNPEEEMERLRQQQKENAEMFGASMFDDDKADKTNAKRKAEDGEAEADAQGAKTKQTPAASAGELSGGEDGGGGEAGGQ